MTNRKVEPVVFNRDGTRDTLHCVLIHPLITEGMSLYAVRQMHVLEPIPSAAKYQQVVAGAVRDGSHSGVAKEDRNVRIYRCVVPRPAPSATTTRRRKCPGACGTTWWAT